MRAPVGRRLVLGTELVTVRDNRCDRHDRGLSASTEPLPYDELVIPRRGVWVRHLRRRQLLVDTTRFHWFARGSRHRVSHPRGCGDRNTGIELSPVAMESLRSEWGALDARGALRKATDGPLSVRAWTAHLQLLEHARAETVDRVAVEEAVLNLVTELFNTLTDAPGGFGQGSTAHVDLAHDARTILASRFDLTLSLTDLAHELEVSPFHLCRVFKDVTGTTLHGFRQDVRVRAAIRRLAESRDPIVDIAAATGFGGRCQLSRAVRAATGESPSGFRRRIRGG